MATTRMRPGSIGASTSGAGVGSRVVAATGGTVTFAGVVGSSGLLVSERTVGRTLRPVLPAPVVSVGAEGRHRGGGRGAGRCRHLGAPLRRGAAPALRRPRRRFAQRLPRPARLPRAAARLATLRRHRRPCPWRIRPRSPRLPPWRPRHPRLGCLGARRARRCSLHCRSRGRRAPRFRSCRSRGTRPRWSLPPPRRPEVPAPSGLPQVARPLSPAAGCRIRRGHASDRRR